MIVYFLLIMVMSSKEDISEKFGIIGFFISFNFYIVRVCSGCWSCRCYGCESG